MGLAILGAHGRVVLTYIKPRQATAERRIPLGRRIASMRRTITRTAPMKICVGSGRGYSGREEPGAFYLGGRRLPVISIVDRWSDPQHAYYKVQVEDGRRFVLRYEPA